MPIRLPQPVWPDELDEEGPAQDPTIFLGADVEIDEAPHRIMALRVQPHHLRVDFKPELDEGVYAEFGLETLLEELSVFDDIDPSVVVRLDSGHYVIWMVPSAGAEGASTIQI